jgi:hypothetical protein
VEIEFDPPMEDLTDFRPRILAWRDEAFKHYKIVGYSRLILLDSPLMTADLTARKAKDRVLLGT